MNRKTASIADRESKAHPLFVKLFLTADADEDREDEKRAGRRGSRRQKRVLRNS
jgi:hypothetical protein